MIQIKSPPIVSQNYHHANTEIVQISNTKKGKGREDNGWGEGEEK